MHSNPLAILKQALKIRNEAVCYKICHIFYIRKELGNSSVSIIFLRLKMVIFFRLCLLLCKALLLDFSNFRFLLKPLFSRKFPLQTSESPLWILRLKELIYILLGLRYFVKEWYLPGFYNTEKPLSLSFSSSRLPRVSIIIAVYNQLDYTLTCLKSLKDNISSKIPYEIILINDSSTDNSSSILPLIKGIKYIENRVNIGFLESCNKAVENAAGDYICLLNNDTIIQNGWLENMMEMIESNGTIGCVGSKVLFPHGLLQEAGGVIFSDGSGEHFGRFQHPDESRFNFTREADYCSGASLLLSKKDFLALGCFDTRYKPAYYEDTDLCFQIRNILKKKVMYVPTSVLVHFEGISSGKKPETGNTKSYQVTNKTKFCLKWQEILNNNHTEPDVYKASRRYVAKRSVMFVFPESRTSHNDMANIESGSRFLQKKGYHAFVVFSKEYPLDSGLRNLKNYGVEIIFNLRGRKLLKKETERAVKASSICLTQENVKAKMKKNFMHFNSNLKFRTIDCE